MILLSGCGDSIGRVYTKGELQNTCQESKRAKFSKEYDDLYSNIFKCKTDRKTCLLFFKADLSFALDDCGSARENFVISNGDTTYDIKNLER